MVNEKRMEQISFKCQYNGYTNGSKWAYVIEIDGFCFPNLSIWLITCITSFQALYSWIDVQIRAYLFHK